MISCVCLSVGLLKGQVWICIHVSYLREGYVFLSNLNRVLSYTLQFVVHQLRVILKVAQETLSKQGTNSNRL